MGRHSLIIILLLSIGIFALAHPDTKPTNKPTNKPMKTKSPTNKPTTITPPPTTKKEKGKKTKGKETMLSWVKVPKYMNDDFWIRI